jgi:hypothetical protein
MGTCPVFAHVGYLGLQQAHDNNPATAEPSAINLHLKFSLTFGLPDRFSPIPSVARL